VSLAAQLGATAVPLLCRKLVAGDESQVAWAYFILARAGGQRAVRALRDVTADSEVSDRRRAVALALLGELGAPLPATVRLLEDRATGARSLGELVRGITEPGDAARAADAFLAAAEGRDLVAMCRRLVSSEGARGAAILEELLARDDVAPSFRHSLAPLRAALGRVPPMGLRASRVLVGVGPAGTAIVATRRRAGSRPRRALVVHLSPDGALTRVLFDDRGTTTFAPRALRARLGEEGFVFRRSTIAAVSAKIAAAARAVCLAGARLPRAFHLGRDLVGLSDEHMAPPPPQSLDLLFERGRWLLEQGDAVRARPLLHAYASVRPEDAEGRTWLGSCLLSLAEVDDALGHLSAAVRLEPEDAVRHWNLAVATKGVGRSGTAFFALLAYLRLARGKGSARRRRLARRFIGTYQRVIAIEHPGVRTRDVAAAEDEFLCACDHLEAGRTLDAVRGFEAVIARVPSHHPSWGNLGSAHLVLGDTAEARRCLETALAYRKDYEPARKGLDRIDAGLGASLD
jgi:tetratricopeptide (TPR) repeat protein